MLHRLLSAFGAACLMSSSAIQPTMAQSVGDAIALISLIRSFEGSAGASDDWLKLELDAQNIKLDQILKNQERLAQGLVALSNQITELEKSFAKELNTQPLKAALSSMSESQSEVENIAKSLENFENLEGDLKKYAYDRARERLELQKKTLPDILVKLTAIDDVYEKLRYRTVSRSSLTQAQLIFGIGLLDAYIARLSPAPVNSAIWYIEKYSGIQRGVDHFIKAVQPALYEDYKKYMMETNPFNWNCLARFASDDRKSHHFHHLAVPGNVIDETYNLDEYLIELSQEKENPDGWPIDLEIGCSFVAYSKPREDPPGWPPSIVRDATIYRDKFHIDRVYFNSGIELVPEKGMVVLDSASGGNRAYWTLAFRRSVAQSHSAVVLEKRQLAPIASFPVFVPEKIIEIVDDDYSKKEAMECHRYCDEITVEEGSASPLGHVYDYLTEYITISSAKALDAFDMYQSLEELKELDERMAAAIEELKK